MTANNINNANKCYGSENRSHISSIPQRPKRKLPENNKDDEEENFGTSFPVLRKPEERK